MGKHRSLFEFSEDSRVHGYSKGSERSICTPDAADVPAQTKVKRRRESIWDRCPRAHRADTMLEEIREQEKSAEEKSDALRNEKKAKHEKEKATAEKIRQAALQTMAIRKSDDSGEKPKKAKLRRSTSDAIGFLAEKSEKERELKKEELAIRKRELDLAETRQEGAAQQQQTMFSALINTMQQQQQLQQQNLQIMLDQQNKVFMALMENIKKH